MNSLPLSIPDDAEQERQLSGFSHCCKPLPPLALYVLLSLFLTGLGVSIFILVVVHNAIFLVSLLSLGALVAAFLLWNCFNFRTRKSLFFFLRTFPDSDLTLALQGQLVKITGLVSCGSVSLESSYEKVSRCVYTSTSLFECGKLGLRPAGAREPCFQWRLLYSEDSQTGWHLMLYDGEIFQESAEPNTLRFFVTRLSTDFYLTDKKSGIRVLVRAGPDNKVTSLVVESRLVKTSKNCKVLSSHLTKWLRDRNLSSEPRPLYLKEGYIREGSAISVIGVLHKETDQVIITSPRDLISTGCLWQKLLLPVDASALIIGVPQQQMA